MRSEEENSRKKGSESEYAGEEEDKEEAEIAKRRAAFVAARAGERCGKAAGDDARDPKQK